MPLIGYHASHEQFPPGELLAHVRRAETAGFTAAMSSDHLSPWLPGQRGVGFAYAWLGAAMNATSLPFGVVTAPGQRYHPAVIAQAAVTLAEMFPGRFWLALGSGEASNEQVTGDPWPSKADRLGRLRECVDVIRALWRGETVDHHGHVRVKHGRVHTTCEHPPALIAAAVTPPTAKWAAAWADGLITVGGPAEQVERTIGAYRDNGGTGPVTVQHHLSWAETDKLAARHAFEQWRHAGIPHPACMELELPEHIEAAATTVRPEDLHEAIAIGADLDRHAEHIATYIRLGADQVQLHQVGPNQAEFIDAFATGVLPAFEGDDRA
ncbi:TIGR03885 family FMN-dependent LLM class oxidoreductase [Phytomonospora endophytica]|uniref:Putative non-F420 flavinoid oxidoreductase n=1 Tax=Phytomonospora endophytica TaxID=714109 RepID=A0A841FSR2_9ACTN|nr:TIGR03885 family FMN-dependent LLM class oxidoreductase [Phytomonospora endophytica]MBB6038844.1 putative non-F420 flavinoid oxidoreductase [Phytomonospora endophytica]GIG68361.1 LLM class F420-dependent oxidoreductase [Phytomonospora endophytica]